MTIDRIIAEALLEDIGTGDVTTDACIPADATGKARLIAKENGVIAGVALAQRIFAQVDPMLRVEPLMKDGHRVSMGEIVLSVSGRSASILRAERLVLNFMQRLSGIATRTAHLVSLCGGTGVKLLDTRKTTPLLRELEKQAVVLGGGFNHRFGLYDMVMVKDNHIDLAGGLRPALGRVHAHLASLGRELRIEVEVRSFEELEEALQIGGFHRIMLDNFSPAALAEAVRIIGGRYETESSGGITEANIRDHALSGVDFISVGALTHNIRSLDLSLKAF